MFRSSSNALEGARHICKVGHTPADQEHLPNSSGLFRVMTREGPKLNPSDSAIQVFAAIIYHAC